MSREGPSGSESWRVVHRSFAEFLAEKVDLGTAHRAVAEHYLGLPVEEFDHYGLRHTPAHLAAAAATLEGPARHAWTEKLRSLVLGPGYQKRFLAELGDPSAFERLLGLALGTEAHDEQASPREMAELALRLVAYRKEQRQAQLIFDLARSGDIEAAERRLDLFTLEVDGAWYQALQLTIAWLCPAASRARARALRNRVQKALALPPARATLDLLLQRVNVTLDDAPLPPLALPPAPAPQEAQAIVLRLSASSVNRSLMAGPDIELMNRREPVAGPRGYLAERDGPELVAAAVANPAFGEPLLQQYVSLHAAYGYREYRQGSLWTLLDAILRHPSQSWVEAWVTALAGAVLAPNRGEFREGLELAVRGLQTFAGEPGAMETLERRRADAVSASEAAVQAPSMNLVGDPARERGDTWGTNRRRLAAMAETLSRLPGDPAEVRNLLTRALGLHWGFAGFNAPACLALADAIEVASPGAGWVAQALAAARTSAHAIQDATFCLRTTARVAAMSTRWWGPFDVAGAASRLSQDASGPEFAAIHVIGQAYDRDPLLTIPLGDAVLNAKTLVQLAEAYQRPFEEFQRLNADPPVEVNQVLAPGTTVNVPDPGFPSLLAARLAARALSSPVLSPADRQRIVRILVPVAASDATALDAVLARLVLASGSLEPSQLAELLDLAMRNQADASPAVELMARLTTFVP